MSEPAISPPAGGLEETIAAWNGLGVVCRYDAPTGTWIFICLHDNTLGTPTGGSRMKVYASLAEALRDGMRLAEGMTYKWAGIDIPAGGGKAVLALREPLEAEARRGLLLRYGELIESLNGTFSTGEDLGTTTEDMAIVAERTQHVQGFDPADGSKVNPSPFTAEGVYRGIRAALGAAFGDDRADGRSVLIQGVGNVGRHVARKLAADGARLLLSDLDGARAAALAEELGGHVVDGGAVYSTECDVYAPCAIGATLNADTIPRLRCRIVAGSANNQLAESADAARLHARRILYAPDYIINAGGALSFALLGQGLADREEILERVGRIGNTVGEILKQATDTDTTPVEVARRRVERRLGGG